MGGTIWRKECNIMPGVPINLRITKWIGKKWLGAGVLKIMFVYIWRV